MTNYPLTLEEFQEWLKSKDKNEVVGWQGWRHGCPIFKCLKDKNNDVVSVNGTTTYVNNKLLENPDWVESFISKVDDCEVVPLKLGEMNASITTQKALEVLGEVI